MGIERRVVRKGSRGIKSIEGGDLNQNNNIMEASNLG